MFPRPEELENLRVSDDVAWTALASLSGDMFSHGVTYIISEACVL
jgi:hypothetical protein